MTVCAVLGCNNRSATTNLKKGGVTYHIFPRHPILRQKWTDACKRQPSWVPTRTSTICSQHFENTQFSEQRNRRILVENAIPTLNLSDNATKVNPPEVAVEPEKLPQKRKMTIPFTSSITSHSGSISSQQDFQGENIQRSQNLPAGDEAGNETTKRRKIENKRGSQSMQSPVSSLKRKSTVVFTPRKIKMQRKIHLQAKKIKSLQSKTRYLKKKVSNLEDVIKELDKKSLISKDQNLVLSKIGEQSAEIFERQLGNSKRGKITRKKFSPELRCFALTLQYYSPKAYKYVRHVFDTALPHPRTLAKWYANIDGRPGFTQEALNALKSLKDTNPEKRIFCTLVIDEMSIATSDEWHPNSQRHFGHVDFGFDYAADSNIPATQALVFLLVGINTVWKVPIGYFLITGSDAKQRAKLVTTAIQLVHNVGVEIKALTCDATRTNVSMALELGCNTDIDDLQTTILDPTTGLKVYFFLDPCHMLKLIRNTFEFYGFFVNSSGTKIDWNFITKLHALQEKELFFLANKLRANYIYFKTKIMNVRLAAQLFSQSVADSLTFCKTELQLDDFRDVSATVDFLKIINDLFDILDSKTCGYGNKKAMCLENYQRCFQRLDEAKTVLMNLLVDVKDTKKGIITRKNVLKSVRYAGFLGFLICIESAKSMFKDLILNEGTGMSFLPFHKISQDHIEILFSIIRSHGGSSNNPTARQLEGIYRKLLVHKELMRNKDGTNCIPLENVNILNCSSAIEKINMTCPNSREKTPFIIHTDEDYEMDFEAEITLTPFGEKVVDYIAGFVVYSLKKKMKCDVCTKGLHGPCDTNSLTFYKTKGKLIFASKNVVSLCTMCEKVIRLELDENNKLSKRCTTQYVVNKSLRFVGENILPDIESHDSDNFVSHKVELARAIMEKYTNTRIAFLTKKTDKKKYIQHIYTKLIHFKNQ